MRDKPRPDGQEFSVGYYAVSPNYFDTMKIPLISGRYFNEEDRMGREPVVIVSQTTARTIWPGENPIGKQMRAPGSAPNLQQEPWSTVVGVVSDVQQWSLDRSGQCNSTARSGKLVSASSLCRPCQRRPAIAHPAASQQREIVRFESGRLECLDDGSACKRFARAPPACDGSSRQFRCSCPSSFLHRHLRNGPVHGRSAHARNS